MRLLIKALDPISFLDMLIQILYLFPQFRHLYCTPWNIKSLSDAFNSSNMISLLSRQRLWYESTNEKLLS